MRTSARAPPRVLQIVLALIPSSSLLYVNANISDGLKTGYNWHVFYNTGRYQVVRNSGCLTRDFGGGNQGSRAGGSEVGKEA